MSRVLRYLRIPWTVFCGIVCVLLIALWMRSYSYIDSTTLLGHEISAWRGQLFLDEGFLHTPTNFDDADVKSTLRHYCSFDILTTTADDASRYGEGWAVPFWLLVGATVSFAATLRLRWRFNLRTLLIATTVVAIVLGLAVYAARN